MPVSYQITLTSEQQNSGPYYEVTYTTGAYFIPVLAGSPAYLPDVGSTAIIQIPTAAASASYLAFNLNNNGEGGPCAYCDNDVILVITGSAPAFECCTGSILSTAISGSAVKITYNSGTGANCLSCSYVTAQTSSNGFDWGGDKTGSCGVSQSITFPIPPASCPATVTYYRIFQTCEGSATPTTTTTTTTTTTSTTTTTTTISGSTTTSTTTTTTTAPTTTTTSTTTTTTTLAGSGSLNVYAKYKDASAQLQYQVNGDPVQALGLISSTTCDYITTITGLVNGDIIVFDSPQTYVVAGDTPPASCPNSGFACSYTHTFGITSTDVYITIDGTVAC